MPPNTRTLVNSGASTPRRGPRQPNVVTKGTSGPYKSVQVQWNSRKAAFDNTGSVETLIQKACVHFRQPTNHEYVLLGTGDDAELELSDDMVKRIPDRTILSLKKISEEGHYCQDENLSMERSFDIPTTNHMLPPALRGPGSYHTTMGTSGTFRGSSGSHSSMLWEGKVFVNKSDGKIVDIEASSNDTVQNIKDRMRDKEGIPQDQQRLIFAGRQLEDDMQLWAYGIRQGWTIHLVPTVRGGKPVIYLFPPTPLPNVDVSINLVNQWSFTHIYPLLHPKRLHHGGQSITWSVSAKPDGTLTETASGLDLSYLFWEAESTLSAQPSPPSTPSDDVASNPLSQEYFDPSAPELSPTSPTAVVLPFSDLLPYLDRALASLTLHTAARNDFITYWLPKLSKKPYVALRFLPQAAYARAATLDVVPAPDVVTRVFMLFRGVAEEGVEEWDEARSRIGAVDWVDVVGVRPGARDESLFKVLEWGAMEVL